MTGKYKGKRGYHKNGEPINVRHGLNKTRFHLIWRSMRSRCNCPKDPAYSNYGGRGIKVCKEWQENLQNFYDDMFIEYCEHCYQHNGDSSLDRIDNDGNYEPSNCRWITRFEQCYNRRSNKIFTKIETIKEIKRLKFRMNYLKKFL